MYFVGIDISKYKHDCFIIDNTGQAVCDPFTFNNDLGGFNNLLTVLKSLDRPDEIRIGFESTGHYASNLKLFLEKAHYSFMEFNPVLINRFNQSQSLRNTKTDTIDCTSIARWLMTVEYKPCSTGFYHIYSLKSLTRLRDFLIRQRSKYLVKITNILDHTFPEFKPFFNNKLGATALYLLENYGTADKMSRMNSKSYDSLNRISRGKFSIQKFLKLKELSKNTVGDSNSFFVAQLNSLLALYKTSAEEINILEEQIISIINELNPRTLTIHGVGPLSAAVICAEYGDFSRFNSPAQMLSFAGLEPSYYQSGTSEHGGRMVKRGSPYLRYTLMNLSIPLIRHNLVFAEYYAKKREEGKTHRVACSHLIKKLIRIIYTLESKDINFDPKKLR